MRYLILLLVLLGCKSIDNSFLMDFSNVTKTEIEKNLLNPLEISDKIIINDKRKKVLNYFLIPVNSTELTHNYSPQNKNTYLFYYKYKIDDNKYLVSIIEKWGHLTDYNQYLGLYDVREDKIKSVLMIFSSNSLKKIKSSYKDEEIIIESTYKNNLEHGLDLNPSIDNSIKIVEKFRISDYFIKVE
jgi:hypothetical protein